MALALESGEIGVTEYLPYLAVTGVDGVRWKVFVWDDPQGELAKVQARLDSGETFTTHTVITSRCGGTYELTLESPAASCELLPMEPTAIRGTLTPPQEEGRPHTFTPDPGQSR
ncbi:hypothetical protein [Streptomyces griseorubiginosus]|uniref:hypothetical protein n=1 Tax=Streptomyces griseorubiginosus TaxID=67304 RepID=UPI0036E40DC9